MTARAPPGSIALVCRLLMIGAAVGDREVVRQSGLPCRQAEALSAESMALLLQRR